MANTTEGKGRFPVILSFGFKQKQRGGAISNVLHQNGIEKSATKKEIIWDLYFKSDNDTTTVNPMGTNGGFFGG